MKKRTVLLWKLYGALLWSLLYPPVATAQTVPADTLQPYRNVAPAMHYLPLLSQKSAAGERYRLEWAVPVRVPVALLDTLKGGLRIDAVHTTGPFALRLHNASEEAWYLKPVLQTPGRQLPPIYQNTIISDFAADLGSAYHPYAPLAAASLVHAAGLPYNEPQLIYLPKQKALGSLNEAVGNALFYLERLPVPARADTGAAWVSTRQLLRLLEQDSRNQVDAATYLRFRLLDMLLGVTNRDEWGWRWMAQPAPNGTVYVPVPQGYESAFGLYEGMLVSIAKIVAPIRHLVSFEKNLPDPKKLNEKALHLDRRFTAGLDEQTWKAAAAQLRTALSDAAIQNAMGALPPAVQTLSGAEIAGKLQNRRNELETYAQQYYLLLAGSVDVLASEAPEYIRIEGENNGSIAVRIQALNKAGQPAAAPVFNRTFQPGQTGEINLYGIGGPDRFDVEGALSKRIKLRIIGGPEPDSLHNRSRSGALRVYDRGANDFAPDNQTRYHLRNDAQVHRYDIDAFAFNKKGIRPMVFYNNNDRLYAGLTYNNIRQGWRKLPFAQRHKAYLNYALLQGGVSAGYEGTFNQVIGRWNGLISAEFDAVRWNNFFGIGNETPPQVLDNDHHRVRSEISSADAGLIRPLGQHHSIGITGRFQTVRIRPDTSRFVAKTMAQDDPMLYRTHQYAGGKLTYTFSDLNDPLLPTKGMLFNASAAYTKNIKIPGREVMDYSTSLQFYVPLAKRLVWMSGGGIQAVTGRPEFYQLATIGGTATLRGFRRERFWGKTAVFNQNELQYLMPFRSYWFNGTVGLIGLFDAGRVWQPGEQSDQLHTGYGAGLLLAPFNRLAVSVLYARSEERGIIHIGVRGSL